MADEGCGNYITYYDHVVHYGCSVLRSGRMKRPSKEVESKMTATSGTALANSEAMGKEGWKYGVLNNTEY